MRLLFIALLFLADHAFAQHIVKISGNIQNRLSDSVLISFNDNRIAYYPHEYYALLDTAGNFSLSFHARPGAYILADMVHRGKVAELILQSGDSLTITVDAAHFDSTIRYSGRGSSIANFVARHKIAQNRMNQYTIGLRTAMNYEPDVFLKTIEAEKQAELSFLDKNKASLPASFIKYWQAYYQYYNYFFMQQYPLTHEMIKRRRVTDTVPEGNYSVIKQMPYAFDDSLLQVPSYLLYLTGVFEIKLKAAGYGTGNDAAARERLQDSVYRLAYKQLPDKSAEYFIAQDIYGRARRRAPTENERQMNVFEKRWPTSTYLPVLAQQVATAHRLSKGQPAPDFDIVTPGGVKKKLSDLRGKVVYLGFWAAWCKQCIAEMIAEQKIKDLIKQNKLEFVYVSINADTAADRKLTEKFKIEGTFTHAIGGWNAKEAALYGVQSLPAYFLIDRDGNFAVQNPSTPKQSTELILEIGKLLK